jgi:glycine betaine/proline transport system permease protein
MQDNQTVASADSSEGGITGPGRLNISVRSLLGATGLVRFLLIVIALAVFLGAFAVIDRVGSEELSEGALFDVPEDWTFQWEGIKAVDGVVEWVVKNWSPFFEGVRTIVLAILIPFRDFLGWLPWWFVVAGVSLAAWRLISVKFGVVILGFLIYMTVMAYIDPAMLTLAITLTAALICVAMGIPIGILTAKSDRFERIARPVLDAMQTLPSFVYLIPAIMLFGMGMTPAVMATVIYSIPPIIRLTGLGIRQVDAQVIEAGKSFGSTSWQLLTKVQVPLAMPTILAGLNQTIMMALAMVVIASMIGAKGLGSEVLNGITRLEPGRGILAGLGIVFMAIILDRMSQAIAARGPETRAAV